MKTRIVTSRAHTVRRGTYNPARRETMNRMTLLCAGLLLLTGVATASTLDDQLSQLGGKDEKARAEARQLLPRLGVDAIPKLLPLLMNEDMNISWAADKVIQEIVAAVIVPGQEANRLFATQQIATLLAPDKPAAVKQRGLRLITIAAPAGFKLDAVAAILSDPDPVMREKARVALEETNTPEAADALCAALGKAEPDFVPALLDAMARMHATGCLPAIVELTKSPDAHTRAMAALALAWTGNVKYIAPLTAVWKAAQDDASAFDACDALLRLTDVMVVKGGNWDTAMGLYRKVLAEDTNIVHRSGAISGLGRYGDETAIQDIVTALSGPDGRELEPAAMAAFVAIQGPAAGKALLAAYPSLSADLRFDLLNTFARKQNPMFLEVINNAARGDDPALRVAAIAALSESTLPAALDGLVANLDNADAAIKDASVAGLKHLADVFRAKDEKDGAGRAFLTLYKIAANDEERLAALEGIKQFPTPESFDVVMATMKPEELDKLPASTLLGFVKGMQAAGRTDDAKKLMNSLVGRLNTPDAVQMAVQVLGASVPGPEVAKLLGFVNTWQIVGPFPWTMSNAFTVVNIGEPNVDLSATYGSADKPLKWQKHESGDAGGSINLMGLIGGDRSCAYALAKINVAEACDVVVRTGSDDGIKVWVNGQAVTEQNVDRPCQPDSDQSPAKLQAGENTILVECTQNGGGWNFCLRITKADGAPLAFTIAE
jgi:HEAT repeat protein